MRTLIKNAILVNEGTSFKGHLLIEDERIARIIPFEKGNDTSISCDRIIDAEGLYLIPGVIDDHVHFREPGLTHKADIETESRAAAAGGVTSYMDMPNVKPQTTDLQTLSEKFLLASEKSLVNYSFFFGATNSNTNLLKDLDKKTVCGVKLFMGSSTGNMLVDEENALRKIFEESPLPIMTHCEDSAIIAQNQAKIQERYGEDPDVIHHPNIRSEEACYHSTELAVKLAKEIGAQLHVAHVTTAKELSLFDNTPLDTKRITAEVCVAHLLYTEQDYTRLGTQIKCNPAIKTKTDRDALRQALNNGLIDLIGTDHAPHLLTEKEGGCVKAVSGMPMIQFSLVSMLRLVDEGIITIERLVELMCHAPARIFKIAQRGFLKEGMQADLVLLRPNTPWTLKKEQILSKCGWSPLENESFNWSVEQTYCNGHLVYNHGIFDTTHRGQQLSFER